VLRSIVVEEANYTGKLVASPYAIIDFWGNVLPSVTWDPVTDEYTNGTDDKKLGNEKATNCPGGNGRNNTDLTTRTRARTYCALIFTHGFH
jgi:hypothetical protein